MRKILSIFLIGLLGGIAGSLLVKDTPQPNLLPFRGEGVDEGRMVKDDGQAEAEEITLTTYYPSPYGVYESMVAVRLGVGDTSGPFGSPDGKYDNLDSPPSNQPGNVWIRGNVGIGTTRPRAKLEVAGQVKITGGSPGANKVLTSDANGLATWQYGVPSGSVMFFNLGACPAGWTALAAAQGRYLVGLPSGGTLAGTQGTALSNLENRAVGQHSHTINDPGHMHNRGMWVHMNPGASPVLEPTPIAGIDGPDTKASISIETTGITINNAGSTPGTNAPYLQLLVCQKD